MGIKNPTPPSDEEEPMRIQTRPNLVPPEGYEIVKADELPFPRFSVCLATRESYNYIFATEDEARAFIETQKQHNVVGRAVLARQERKDDNGTIWGTNLDSIELSVLS